jgi:tetratricopeptide (TPR) repeat protein
MVVYALGLMAKPMLVTLPLVLLLLDYWPLGRMGTAAAAKGMSVATGRQPRRSSFPASLVFEKLPLLLLAVVCCVLTLWAQSKAVVQLGLIPFEWRIANALVSSVAYLRQLFWPVGLNAFYPYLKDNLPAWRVIGALVVLACVSAGALAWRRRRPYLLVGWLWYLGMLVPVIGLVQVGGQAMADRFTYLTQIGLYIALAWGVADVCRSWPYRRWLCGLTSALVLTILMGCAWRQTSFWRDSGTLWTRALACTSQNGLAHTSLAVALAERGQWDEAMAHYRKALEIDPSDARAHNNLGVVLAERGQWDEAMAHYRKALEINPGNIRTHNNVAVALARAGRFDKALAHYRKAVEIDPDDANAHINLGAFLQSRGGLAEAIAHFERAVDLKPHDARAHGKLGMALQSQGRIDEAIDHFQRAVEIEPDDAEAHNRLGVALPSRGRIDEAIDHFQRAVKIEPDDADVHYNFGVALQMLGRIGEATAHFQRAVEIKPDYAEAHNNLGAALAGQGRFHEALTQNRKALKINHDYLQAHSNLAWLLASCPEASLRNGAEAVEHARRADQLCGGRQPIVFDTLAIAYAEAGRFPEALAAARKALDLATQQNRQALAEALRARIALYEAGKPYRQPLSASVPAKP